MHDDTNFEEERQRLITLIWECPASEVAQGIGCLGCRPGQALQAATGAKTAARLLGQGGDG